MICCSLLWLKKTHVVVKNSTRLNHLVQPNLANFFEGDTQITGAGLECQIQDTGQKFNTKREELISANRWIKVPSLWIMKGS